MNLGSIKSGVLKPLKKCLTCLNAAWHAHFTRRKTIGGDLWVRHVLLKNHLSQGKVNATFFKYLEDVPCARPIWGMEMSGRLRSRMAGNIEADVLERANKALAAMQIQSARFLGLCAIEAGQVRGIASGYNVFANRTWDDPAHANLVRKSLRGTTDANSQEYIMWMRELRRLASQAELIQPQSIKTL